MSAARSGSLDIKGTNSENSDLIAIINALIFVEGVILVTNIRVINYDTRNFIPKSLLELHLSLLVAFIQAILIILILALLVHHELVSRTDNRIRSNFSCVLKLVLV